MIATATDISRRAGEATNERDPSRRPAGVDAVSGGDLGAFDLVLNVAKSALEVRARQSGSDSSAPAQMFEPIESDAHGRRQAALRADARHEANTTGRARFDRTGVEVRRESARSTGVGGAGSVGTIAGTKQTTQLGGSDTSARVLLAHQELTEASAGRPNATPRPTVPDPSAVREAGLSATTETQTVANISKEGLGRVAEIVGVSTAGQQPSSAGGSDGVAGKVGQLLGASRIGGTELARAPQAAESASDGRPQVQTQRTTSRPTQLERSSEERPSQRSEAGERAKPFDELVRSIRLRPGSYRSSARMHLNPPELGRVSIDVRLEGERLHVDVRTEHAEAAKLLQDRAAQLRAALAQHGIVVERFDVDMHTWEQGDGFVAPDGSSGDSSEWSAARRHTVSSPPFDSGGMEDGGRGEHGPDWDELVAVVERRLDVRI